MNDDKKLFIFLISLIILFSVFTLTMLSYFFIGSNSDYFLINFFVKYHFLFMFICTILALFFGFISYYFIAKNFNSSKKIQLSYLNDILNLLENDEKNILEYLIKNGGSASQYELVKISNSHKVRVHRIIEKFENNQIIEKQKVGKINKIYLNKKYLIK